MEQNNNTLVVAVVGHITIDELANLKEHIEKFPGFKIIFFKTSSEKLWIKEGDNADK